MEVNLVSEGLKFMVLGMVTVFLFLVLLVIVLNFQAKIITKFFPPKVVAPTKRSVSPSSQQSKSNNNLALVAAITAAITTFKNSKKV